MSFRSADRFAKAIRTASAARSKAHRARQNALNLVPDWASIELERKLVLSTVTWDGGAGTMNWGDAGNWSNDILPTAVDDVVIPDLSGVQTIQLNISAGVASVNSAEGLTIESGQWLTVSGGSSSEVTGLFTVQGALRATNANTTFKALNSSNMTNASIYSDDGAVVTIGGMSQADNASLMARYGGVLNLTDLNYSSNSYYGANWEGDGYGRKSVLNIPVLQSSASSTQYRALDGGVINSPSLNNLDGDSVWIRGANSTMNLQGVSVLNNTQIQLDNENEISTLPFTSLTNGSHFYSDSSSNITLPNLTNLTNSGLYARYGGVITASVLTDVTNGDLGANWDGDGYGRRSVLNIPMLQSSASSTQYRALDGGVINSPSLNNLDGDSVWIRGANSTMDLQGVSVLNNTQIQLDNENEISTLPFTSITNWSNIYSDYSSNVILPSLTTLSNSGLHARYGGVLTASVLTDVTNAYLGANWDGDGYGRHSVLNIPLLQSSASSTQYRALDGGEINSPSLNNLDGDNIWIRGSNSTMNLLNVTGLNSSYLNIDSANAITSLSISNMTGSTLYLQSSAITQVPLTAVQGSAIYTWYSSNVTLPLLASATDSTFRADYGGRLSLPVLSNVSGGGFGSNWDGDSWDQRASVLSLPELQGTIGYTQYRVLDGGTIQSPKLDNLSNDNVYIRGANASMGLSNVTTLNSSYVNLDNASSITSLSISNMTGSTLIAGYSSNVTLPLLASATESTFRADYGGRLSLPVLSKVTGGGFGSNWDGDYWDQRASVLSLPELQGTIGYTQYRVLDGGTIQSPKLDNLSNDNVYIRGANASMGLSNVTALNSSYVNLDNASSITSLSISNMTGSTLIAGYSSNVTLPLLASATDSTFRADYGGRLSLPVLSNVTGGGFGSNWDGDYWDQRASVLSLPELQSTSASTQYRVLDGGTIQSPKLDNLSNDNVYIRGANASMGLSNVTALNSSYVNLDNASSITSLSISNMTGSTLIAGYSSNITLPLLVSATESTFRADYGGHLSLPVLSNVTGGGFGSNWDGDYWDQRASVLSLPELQGTIGYTQYRVLDGGTIQSPKLDNLNNDNVYIRGANATMGLSNVTTLNSSYVNLDNASSITSLSISNMTGSTLIAGYSSNVTLPLLASATDSTFRADYGGNLDLPELKSVSGGGFGANWDGDWYYKRPSKLTLAKFEGNTNSTAFIASDSGLISVTSYSFSLTGSSSYIRVNNSGMLQGNVTLRNGASINSSYSDGTIDGNVVNDGGVVVPNYSGGSGKLTVTGNYTQTSAGVLNIDLNGTTPGTGYDQLLVGGTATLAGRLNVSLGYSPSNGDSFEIVHAASVVNDFQIKAMPTLYGSVRLTESTNATAATINTIATPALTVSDAYNYEGDNGYGNTLAFRISGVAPAGGLTINYNTTGGSPGVDYVAKSGSFSVAGGQYSQTVYVTITGNQLLQADRLFQFEASATGLATVIATGMIYDDDAPVSIAFSANPIVAHPNETFSPSPTITVRNRNWNGVQGATVNLLVGSGIAGASATFADGTNLANLTTGSDGSAAVASLTANSKFGTYRLSADSLSLSGIVTASGNMTLVNAGINGISWDGGAGTTNWNDELNWNEDRVPMSFDDVVIADLPGSQTIILAGSSTVKSVQSAESLSITSSSSLSLTTGHSSIAGSLILNSGSSLSANGTSNLVVTGGGNIVSACITASSGASIEISGVSTAINPKLYADGYNSKIRLNGLESIQSDYYSGYTYPIFDARNDGAILLPDLIFTTRVGNGYNQGQINIFGGQSQIRIPNLTRLDGFEWISVSNRAQISIPQVTSANNLYLYASGSGSFISFPNLTTINSNSMIGGRRQTDLYAYDNATISLPSLKSILRQDSGASSGCISISYQGSRINAPMLGDISAIATINAYSDVILETSGNLTNSGNLTIYSSGKLALGNLHFSNTNLVMVNNPGLSGNLFLESGAIMNGAGSIYGNLTVNSGELKISNDSPSVFNVYGDYTQGQAGTLEVRIGGCNTTTYNKLQVSGTANIGGSLTGGFTGSDVPVIGRTYEILKAGSVLNNFGNVSLDQYGWIGLSQSYTSDSVLLTTTTSNLPPNLWTMNSPAGGTLPAGVTLVGGLVLDMVGVNDVRVVSQLSANSLFIGFYDGGSPSAYRGNPGTIGIQAGITPNAVNALGGGLKKIAVRMTLWDGDTGHGDFDRNQNTFYLNGVQMGDYSDVVTQQTSTNGLIVYSNNTNGGFRDETLDTGFFFSNSTSFLTNFFNTLTSGNVKFTSYDTDPYDNYYDYTQGIAGGLINVGLDPNVSPSSILLSNNSIAENQPVGTLVGTLSAVDANAGDTHTFALISGSGSDDNASFSIVGNKLYSNAVFNYESKSLFSIRVRTTDNGGLSYDQVLTIQVTDVNEQPTNVTAGGPYQVWQGQSVTFSASATDPDANATISYSWDLNNDGVFGDATGQNPTLSWAQLNTFGISATGLRNIKVRATDGLGGSTDSPVSNLTVNETVLHALTANQSATVGTAFANPLQVSATDLNGNPLENVVITFNAPVAGASVSFAGGAFNATSGNDGISTSGPITANGLAGEYLVTATVPGVTASATFGLKNVTSGPSSIEIVSGNGKSAVVGTQFVQLLKVKALDSSGVGLAGVNVTFAAPATGASGSFDGGVNTAVTDADGIATAPAFSANSTWGSFVVAASVTGVSPLSFVMTNTPFAGAVVVNTTSDAVETGYTNLRQAVAFTAAQSGDNTVLFDPTLFASNQTITLSSVIPIKDSTGKTTIQGPESRTVRISGNNTIGLFLVKSPSTMTNLTLTNATGAGTLGGASSGGAILNISCLTLEHISIYNSSVNNGYGGAIASSYGGNDYPNDITANVSLVASNLVISNTTSGSNWGLGGAIYSGAYNTGTSTTLVLLDSCISDTNAKIGGGAINHQTGYFGGTANLVISNLTLSNTTSGMMAGGILIGASSASNVTIDKLKADKSSSGSGGLLEADIDLSAANNSFITVSNSTISNTSATDGGVFLFKGGKNLVVRDSSIINTTATGNGGVVSIVSSDDTNLAKLNLSNIVVTNQTANKGGAIYASNTILKISNSTFNNSNAVTGGVVFNGGASGNAILLINDSTFMNSSAKEAGVISNNGYSGKASLSINNSRFINSSAMYGGVIDNDGRLGTTSLTIIGCNFVNSNASGGGVVYNYVHHGDSSMTIVNSSFANSTAYDGGIILNDAYRGNAILTISNSTMANSTAKYMGGAFVNYGGSGNASLTINNTTFSHSVAEKGGVIYNESDYGVAGINISNSSFDGSTANSGGVLYNLGNCGTAAVTFSNTLFTNSTASSSGGVIASSGIGNLMVRDTSFTNSSATANGGLIQIDSGNALSPGVLNISNISVNNTTANYGGGIYASNSVVSIEKMNLANAYATNNGGGIYAAASTLVANNITISDSLGNNGAGIYFMTGNLKLANATMQRNNSTTSGGALYLGTGNITINGTLFQDNVSASNGGGIYIADTAQVNINSSTFSRNRSSMGGAIDNGNTYSTIDITGSSFTDNSATQHGGAIGNGIGNLTVSNSTFLRNSAPAGGAIMNFTNLVISDSTLSYNNATSGGAISGRYSGSTQAISNVTMSYNNAMNGGALELYSANGIVSNTTISENRGVDYGGGISIRGGSAMIENSCVTLNSSNATNGYGMGAGIFNDGTLSIKNSLVSKNSATTYGAGIASQSGNLTIDSTEISYNNGQWGAGVMFSGFSNLSVTNSTISDNVASNVSGGGLSISSSGIAVISNSSILRNVSASNGGAIRARNANLKLDNVLISDNIAANGAAIYVQTTTQSTLTVDNTTLLRNQASNSGGGFYLSGANTTASVSNSTLALNNANGSGGAFYLESAVLLLNQSTLALNNATDGGAIYSTGQTNQSSVELNQSTISRNTAHSGAGITNANVSSRLISVNSIIAENLSVNGDNNIDGHITQSTNSLYSSSPLIENNINSIVGTPALLAPLGNYGGTTQTMPPLPGSPAIGGGTAGTMVPATDQRGKTRGSTIDIGSVQTQGFSVSSPTGGGQSTAVGNAFGNPLSLKITANDSSDPVSGGVVTFNMPATGASATYNADQNESVIDANGVATSSTLKANSVIGNYNAIATASGIVAQAFSLTNNPPSVTAFTVQKGAVGRSFVRYIDLDFNTPATLGEIVSSIGTGSPRIRMTNTGLDGSQNVNYNLAGKIAAIDAVLAMNFGDQGIGSDRNSATGDGSYLIELDLDGNGSFETSRRFFRLLGDVNGDKVVDALDSSIVAANIGATGANLAADVNGDGVVNAADTLLARRQRGRRITI